MLRIIGFLSCLLLAFEFSTEVACAHFLFAHVVGGARPRIELHFAESAWDFSSNGRMVGLMEPARSWSLDGQPLDFESHPHAMVCLGHPDQTLACSEFTYGLMSRGETFLLQYHAKGVAGIDFAGEKGGLDAEIIAKRTGDEKLILTVLSKGAPVPNAEIVVPLEGMKTEQMTTDERGQVEISMPKTPIYSFRAMVPEERSGTHDDKSFDLVRHYTTLTVHQSDDVPSDSDGLAWAVLQDAIRCNAANVDMNRDWQANFRMTTPTESNQGRLMHESGVVGIVKPDDNQPQIMEMIRLIGGIPTTDVIENARMNFESMRSPSVGSRVVIPEFGLIYVIKDRYIEAIIEDSPNGVRRTDVTGRMKLADGRYLPEQLVITEFEKNGTIQSVTLINEIYTQEDGTHLLKTRTAHRVAGPDQVDPTTLRLSEFQFSKR